MSGYFSIKRIIPVAIIALMLPIMGCFGDEGYYPSYPYGGEYDGGYGGGDYGGYYPPYDDGPDLARLVEGEWEGFMWEDYRSDHRPPGKKKLAMRIRYSDTTYDYSGRREWVDVNVLVDGRPAASSRTRVNSGGYIHLSSYRNDIQFEMHARFHSDDGEGEIDLTWDEKYKDEWTGKTETCRVRTRGDFEVGRVRHGHWAAAWELFDTYRDGIWELPDSVWETATLEGIEHLETIEQNFVRSTL